MSIEKVKSEIIQYFLFKYVKSLAKEYSGYLKVNDSNMLNDNEMYIYIDSKYSDNEFENKDMYKIHLSDFEWKCKDFILELEKKIPTKYLEFSEHFSYTVIDGKEYYESCELHFKIKNVEG